MPSRDIKLLHPDLLPLCEQFLKDCHDEGLDVFITETWRDPAYQDKLYAKGRTAPGKIVTQLKGSKSKHCFTIKGKPASKAFDIMIKTREGKMIEDGAHPFYAATGEIGEDLGLIWGGNWKNFKDYGHFQLDA